MRSYLKGFRETGRYEGRGGPPRDVCGLLLDFRGGALHISLPSPDAYSIHAPAAREAIGNAGGEAAGEFRVLSGRGAGERARFQTGDGDDVSGFTLGGWWYRREAASQDISRPATDV